MESSNQSSPPRSSRSPSSRQPPSSPRIERIEEFADRMFSMHSSELIRVHSETSRKFSFRTLLAFAGPGILTSVAFVDPGNIESDLQAGAYGGYRLLWVVALSTFIGLLFQSLAARLGTVTGKDLATNCFEKFATGDVQLLWFMTQIAIVGSDIQEIVGSAVAFRLLFGFPLWVGCLLTGLDTLTFLGLHATGIRRLEAVFGVLILTMVICFFANFIMTKPDPVQILGGIFIPSVTERNAIQAASILGAVIMPHNIYLHSALVLSRDIDRSQNSEVREANFYFTVEAALALFVAFLINVAIVSVFAQGFYSPTCENIGHNLILSGGEHISPPYACLMDDARMEASNKHCESGMSITGTCQPIGLQVAEKPLEALLGSAATILWAIGLLAAGQSSTVTGTYAGQFVMEGMLQLELPNWKRVAFTRGVALVPSTFVAIVASHDYFAADRLDEWLNVVQTIQLPFALVPLLTCCSDESLMGDFCLTKTEKRIGWGLGLVVILVNIILLGDKLWSQDWRIIGLAVVCAMIYVSFLRRFTPQFARPSTKQTAGEELLSSGENDRLIQENKTHFPFYS